jgi:hypothetical protein
MPDDVTLRVASMAHSADDAEEVKRLRVLVDEEYYNRFIIRAGNRVAKWLRFLADVCAEGSLRLHRCEDCGRSTFYGNPCKN